MHSRGLLWIGMAMAFGCSSTSAVDDAGHADASTKADASARVCASGQQIACPCPAGKPSGVQACAANGQGYGACTGCSSPDASPAKRDGGDDAHVPDAGVDTFVAPPQSIDAGQDATPAPVDAGVDARPQECVEAGGLFCNNVCGIWTDGTNCGACGVTCTKGPCVAGECTVSCPAGQTVCDGNCADTQDDEDNCGQCGTYCGGAPSECLQGVCQVPTFDGCAHSPCSAGIALADGCDSLHDNIVSQVCDEVDASCCSSEWDSSCVSAAQALCDGGVQQCSDTGC
jgi:hypothetical protein